MSLENSPESIENYNRAMFNVNNFMVEQTEAGDYNQLVNTVIDQLDKLLRPIAITYNEYDEQNRTLRTKEIKANQGILDKFLKISGKKISSFVSPVDAKLYEEIIAERLEIVPTLHEATGRAVPKTVSSAVSKAIGIKCYLGLAYVVDGQLFGTSAIALKEAPAPSIMKLLKTYTYHTSMTIKRILTEEALKKRERELSTITGNMTDLVSMTDPEGRLTFLSGNHYELTGYHKKELLNKNVSELVYSEDFDGIANLFNRHLAVEEDGRVEYRLARKDGSLTWVETVGSILYDNGVVSGALFVTRDISDRKKAEEALKQSEQTLNRITENITDVVAMADLEGKFTYISESSYAVFGYKPEEVIGKDILELIHKEDLSKVGSLF